MLETLPRRACHSSCDLPTNFERTCACSVRGFDTCLGAAHHSPCTQEDTSCSGSPCSSLFCTACPMDAAQAPWNRGTARARPAVVQKPVTYDRLHRRFKQPDGRGCHRRYLCLASYSSWLLPPCSCTRADTSDRFIRWRVRSTSMAIASGLCGAMTCWLMLRARFARANVIFHPFSRDHFALLCGEP